MGLKRSGSGIIAENLRLGKNGGRLRTCKWYEFLNLRKNFGGSCSVSEFIRFDCTFCYNKRENECRGGQDRISVADLQSVEKKSIFDIELRRG